VSEVRKFSSRTENVARSASAKSEPFFVQPLPYDHTPLKKDNEPLWIPYNSEHTGDL
jgi:hypothetical protein